MDKIIYPAILLIIVAVAVAFIMLSTKLEVLTEKNRSLAYQLASASDAAQLCNDKVAQMEKDQEKADLVAVSERQTVEVETVRWKDRVVVELKKDPSCENELLLIEQQLKEVLSL